MIADWAGDPELPEGVAEVIEEAMLAAVGQMHTGKLRRLGEQLLKDLAPGVYEDRRKQALKDRHVDVTDNPDGTATLKASQVNKAIAHRVYDQLRADAQQLQRLGDDRTLGTIMADLMLRRALGEIDDPKGDNGPDGSNGSNGSNGNNGNGGDGSGGEPDGGGHGLADDAMVVADGEPVPWPEAPPPDGEPDPGDDGADAEASGWLTMAALTRRRVRLGDADLLPDVPPGDEGRCGRKDACDRCGPPATVPDRGRWQVRLIHQPGIGLDDLRKDAARLLRHGVCVSIIDADGKLIQHGSGHYVPSPGMRKIIQDRHGYCAFPGCLRRAHKCEADHSLAWPEGPTCNCNIATLCKRHHMMKHTPRWELAQPQPGLIEWTTPGGRRVEVDRRPP